jgi:hypothetical protein
LRVRVRGELEEEPGEQRRRRLVAREEKRRNLCTCASAWAAPVSKMRTANDIRVGELLARVRGRIRTHEEREQVARARVRELLALRGLEHGGGLALGEQLRADARHHAQCMLRLAVVRRRLGPREVLVYLASEVHVPDGGIPG